MIDKKIKFFLFVQFVFLMTFPLTACEVTAPVSDKNKANPSDTSGETSKGQYDGYWQHANGYLIANGTMGYICAEDLKSSSRFVIENDRMMRGDYFSNDSLSLSPDKQTLNRTGEDKGVKYTVLYTKTEKLSPRCESEWRSLSSK
jgi:hypothetical protein